MPPPQPVRSRIELPLNPPCKWEGAIVSTCLGCQPDRGHERQCTHPTADRDTCTRGNIKSALQACNACPDYINPSDPSLVLIAISQPPPFTGKPIRSRAIVTVAAGEKGRAQHALSRPWQAAYAARLDADYVVLDWPGASSWPLSAKYALPTVLDAYERIIALDADTLADPLLAPDLFAMVAPDEFGAADELVWHARRPQFGIEAEYHTVRRWVGMNDSRLDWYFNAGVMVLGRKHQSCLAAPREPIPKFHCSEQHLDNVRVRERGGFRTLPRECNWQWWQDGHFDVAPPGAILHFSGLSFPERIRMMMAVC